MLADSQKLANKWQDSGLLEGIEDNRVKNNMAMILENQAKQIVAEANVLELAVVLLLVKESSGQV